MNNEDLRKAIFILDDENEVLKVCKKFLSTSKLPCDIYTFTNYKDMLSHPYINEVSLFILDVLLPEKSGKEICLEILNNSCTSSTFLFISGKSFVFEEFSDLGCTYDFIKKPFKRIEFVNRCKLLLSVSDKYCELYEKTRKIEIGLWDVFNYSNIYLLILDSGLNIRLCSYMLAIDLGFKSEDEIIGESWLDFIPDDMKVNIDLIHKTVLNNPNSDSKKYQEVTNDVKTKDNKIITVRWFNTCINNGVKLTFSIGVPLTKDITKEDNIETLRAFWAEKINKDEIALNAFRDLMKIK